MVVIELLLDHNHETIAETSIYIIGPMFFSCLFFPVCCVLVFLTANKDVLH